MSVRPLALFAVVLITGALYAADARAGDEVAAPAEPVPCAGTDRATVLANLDNDRSLSKLRAWERQTVEFLDCAGPNIPLRLSYLSAESASRKLGVRYTLALELEYDVATGKIVAPEPDLDVLRQAADTAVRAADKSAVLGELKAAVEAAGGSLRGTIDGSGRATVHLDGLGEASATFREETLVELALPHDVDVPSSLQVTAFKGLVTAIEHEGASCPAPAFFQTTHGDDGSWTFVFEHAKGACKGKWQLVMTKNSDVSWERL